MSTSTTHATQEKTPQPLRRDSAHRPPAVYNLTLNLTPSISDPINALRAQYLPTHLPTTPTRITLFHALPASYLPLLLSTITTTTSTTRPYQVSTGRAFRMRRGVGVRLDSGVAASEQLREELRERWEHLLGWRDTATAWVPYWTLMQGVDDEKSVQVALACIRRGLCQKGFRGTAVGVTLWRVEEDVSVRVREWGFLGGAGEGELLTRLGKKVVRAWKAVLGRRGLEGDDDEECRDASGKQRLARIEEESETWAPF